MCLDSLKTLDVLRRLKQISDKEYEEHSKTKLLFLKKTKWFPLGESLCLKSIEPF